ncbi:MAG: hypothetical protein LBM09_00510 [Candidatus Nomurabacteria bacterium]|jgi:hypothetical protein|nr:hypothetical protein [Candidatus Nomurabacteria bacterium]
MQQILIATTSAGKIRSAKAQLSKLGLEGLSFADLNLHLAEPDETADTAENIAREKAIGYAKQFHDLPVLARDDVSFLRGVTDEDDLKNHNKEFVVRKMGEYSDANGEKVFADLARKYGGTIPLEFHWGYALAWRKNDKNNVVSDTAIKEFRLIDKPSPVKAAGFSFAAISQVKLNGVWRYDTELTEDETWQAYWNLQMETIEKLLQRAKSL